VSAAPPSGRFLRLAEATRRPITLTIGSERIQALEGDTLLTALLLARGSLRQSEFGDGARAGFCLMGACQDCWVALADGRRFRACTTMAEDGMALEAIP
jgi:aerobic-type carbon monoxide dehydrogenase small subunit (CoxS/CutS family)